MSRLLLFLALYFSVYGSINLYLLIKIRRAFYLEGVHYLLLFAVLTFLLIAPINARLLEMQGYWLLSTILAWSGFVWMGFVFLFSCLSLPLDGFHILIGMGQQLFDTDWTSFMLSKKQRVTAVSLITCILMAYGAIEAYNIKTETITLRTNKVSTKTGTIRIVQISDVHIGPMLYPGRLSAMVEAINKAQPHILVSTGDLIDGHIRNSDDIAAALNSIPAPMGKYAVGGNHEVYAKTHNPLAFTRKAGFTYLDNQSVSVTKDLVITGIEDPASERGKNEIDKLETELLGRVSGKKFSLLLKHRPTINPASTDNMDLQLSGHTHQGQIFPFGLLVRLSYPLNHGLHQFAPNRHMYVNRGTGTWGPPIRILAPPEITIIDLMPSKN